MRLSDVLSKDPTHEFAQVEGFMDNKALYYGKQRKIEIGSVALNYYCNKCANIRTFLANESVFCLGVDNKTISIDLNLRCICGTDAQAWFLIESENDISSYAPKIKIIKKSERLGSQVSKNPNHFGYESILLDKADQAFRDGLGIGSMVYLRIIYEDITKRVADQIGVSTKTANGKRKTFSTLLEEVDKLQHIIPREFSNQGYKLFSELSETIHGNVDEEKALTKYGPCRRLIVGILENIRNNEEIKVAIDDLKWNQKESEGVK